MGASDAFRPKSSMKLWSYSKTYFFKVLFFNREIRGVRERKRESISIHWFTPPEAQMARAGPGQNPEARKSINQFGWQELKHESLSLCLPESASTGSWNQGPRLDTKLRHFGLECGHLNQQLNFWAKPYPWSCACFLIFVFNCSKGRDRQRSSYHQSTPF